MTLDPPIRRIVEGSRRQPLSERPADFFERRRRGRRDVDADPPRAPSPAIKAYEDRTIAVDEWRDHRADHAADRALHGPDADARSYITAAANRRATSTPAEVECGPLASMVPCLVVSVGYRLAPEHPFPTPLHDCAPLPTSGCSSHHEVSLGALDRVAVGGGSAGANLAAALCLVARDRGLPSPASNCSRHLPAFDLTMASKSFDEHGHPGFDREAIGELDRLLPRRRRRRDPSLGLAALRARPGGPAAGSRSALASLDPVAATTASATSSGSTRAPDVPRPLGSVPRLSHPHGGRIIPVSPTWRLMGDLRPAAVRRAFDGTLVLFA